MELDVFHWPFAIQLEDFQSELSRVARIPNAGQR